MNDVEAKAEEVRQLVLKLDEWYGPHDYVAVFKNLGDASWLAALTAIEGDSLYLPYESEGSGKWAESEWKPTPVEALESLREILLPYMGEDE